MTKFRIKTVKGIESNATTLLLNKPKGPNPHDSLNQPINSAEDALNRLGGGAGSNIDWTKLNALLTLISSPTQNDVVKAPEIHTDFRKFHHPCDQGRNSPRTIEEVEHYFLAKKEIAKQIDYAQGQDTDNLASALGISPTNVRHGKAIAKSHVAVPRDSYQSAGELTQEKVREKTRQQLSKDQKRVEKQSFEDELTLSALGGRPFPWKGR